MAPGWTNYRKRLQYQIYDVTNLLGDTNQIQVTVANGWYKGILGFYCQPNQYGDQLGLFAELHLQYENGDKEVIATDENWTVRTGQIRCSEIYMGETIDTDSPEILEGSISIKNFDSSVLTAQEDEPVRITERIAGIRKITTPRAESLIDFGQIVTGVVELHVKASRGQVIRLRHAEVLDKDGNFYPDTLRQAKSIDTFICNMNGHYYLYGTRSETAFIGQAFGPARSKHLPERAKAVSLIRFTYSLLSLISLTSWITRVGRRARPRISRYWF